eukprot:scaffold101962_cov63-Phaeocystis_antarctica.AAC.3
MARSERVGRVGARVRVRVRVRDGAKVRGRAFLTSSSRGRAFSGLTWTVAPAEPGGSSNRVESRLGITHHRAIRLACYTAPRCW